MKHFHDVRIITILSILLVVVDISCASSADDEHTQIIKAEVGPAVMVGDCSSTNSCSVQCSPSGAIMATYPTVTWPGMEGKNWHVYTVSYDGGLTWTERQTLWGEPEFSDGSGWKTRKKGSVTMCGSAVYQIPDEKDWFQADWVLFSDDFNTRVWEKSRLYIPDVVPTYQEGRTPEQTFAGPVFSGMTYLDDGTWMAVMAGWFKGGWSIPLVKSEDFGKTWQFVSFVAQTEVLGDPIPEYPVEFGGYGEPALTQLKDGRLLCVMRSQSSHLAPDFKPMYCAWSDDLGKTWTKPQVTDPLLINIAPTLKTLDNGIVACMYGRPGLHIAFSLDGGKTWPKRVSFSHSGNTGQSTMTKIGPNKLMAIGAIGGPGTFVWPVTAEIVEVPKAKPFQLTGHVVDEKGNAIPHAKVQLGKFQYTTVDGKPIDYKAIQESNGPITKTDAHGRFAFDLKERRGAVLTIEADGFAPVVHHVDNAEPGMPEIPLTMHKGTALSGRVVDQYGKGVQTCCVIFGGDWDSYRDTPPAHTHTDVNGHFDMVIDGDVSDQMPIRLIRKGYSQAARVLSPSDVESQLMVYDLPYPLNGAPVGECLRREETPAIEADFDDPAWQDAPVIDTFVTQATPGAEQIPVKARFISDHKHLHMIIKVGPTDVQLDDEDLLEVAVVHKDDQSPAHQFVCNTKGMVRGRFAWNCPWPVVHTRRNEDGGWTLSMKMWWLQIGHRYPTPTGIGITHIQAFEGQKEPGLKQPATFSYFQLEVERKENEKD
jgi:hypothetical protein